MLPDLDWVGFGFDLDLRPAANVVDGQIVKLDSGKPTPKKGQ